MDNELQARAGSVKVDNVSFPYASSLIQHTQVCVGQECYGWGPAGDVGWQLSSQGIGIGAAASFSSENRGGTNPKGAWVSDSYTIPNTTRQDVLTALRDLGNELIRDGFKYSVNNNGEKSINCHGFASIAKDQLPWRAQMLTQGRTRADGELGENMTTAELTDLEKQVASIFKELQAKGVTMSQSDGSELKASTSAINLSMQQDRKNGAMLG